MLRSCSVILAKEDLWKINFSMEIFGFRRNLKSEVIALFT